MYTKVYNGNKNFKYTDKMFRVKRLLLSRFPVEIYMHITLKVLFYIILIVNVFKF